MDSGTESYRSFLAGDDNGFIEIVRDYKDGLILYLDSFVRNIPIAEELAEDTFVRLGVRKPRFSEKSAFRTWLYAIGRNVAIDFLRKQSGKTVLSEEDCAAFSENETPETAYLAEERKIVLHKAMRKLKAEYRQVLWLIYFDGFSLEEAAFVMRKTKHGTESLAYRARQALKQELIREGLTDEKLS